MKKYFYTNNKEKLGPFSLDEIKNENINNNTLIWFEGLDDWTDAKYILELKEILELSPPPISTLNKKPESEDEFEGAKITSQKPEIKGLKEASQGWIIAGFIFSLLGGYLGVAIGFNYAFGNYEKGTKRLGWVMAILGFFSAAIWRSL